MNPALPPAGNFDLSHWYLTLPEPGAPIIMPAALAGGYTNAAWFYTSADGSMTFWCPVTGGTTPSSSYPRSELRETLDPLDLAVNWPALGTHVLEAQCRLLQAPSNGRVVLGQIHAYFDNAPALALIKYEGGEVNLEVRISPAVSGSIKLPLGTVELEQPIHYRIHLQNGVLSASLNGVSQSADLFKLNPGWSNQTFYFKAGSYCQDNSGDSSEGSLVSFQQIEASHVFAEAAPALWLQPTNQTGDAGSNVVLRAIATGTPPLFYQWQRNGLDLPVTNSFLFFTPVSTSDAGLYRVVVTNQFGSVTSAVAALLVRSIPPPPPPPSVSPLADAVDAPALIWTTSGSPAWLAQTNVTRDGADAAQSGAIGHSQTTVLQTTVAGPGTVGFWWKVSSEKDNDRLLFHVGTSEKARVSGEIDWQWKTFSVSSGNQVLKWTYSKNSSKTGGVDRAWLDQVRYIPNSPPSPPVIASQPAGVRAEQGAAVSFTVGAMGPPTLKYQWYFAGAKLADSSSAGISGATSATLKLSGVSPARAGLYTVVVANSAGAITSAPALLVVPTLAEAVDAPGLAWTTNGTPAWVGQGSVTHDGQDAARSGTIDHKKTNSMQAVVQGPGTVLFWWKVSSQTNKDVLTFSIGGAEAARISGEVNWQLRALQVPAGSRTLRWSYAKDSGTTAGQDRAWVDELRFIGTNVPNALPGAASIADAVVRANDYFIATTTFQSNGWARGVYQTGNMRAYGALGVDRFRAYAQQWGEYFQWQGGFRGRTNADGQVCGQTYFDLYELDPQPVRLAEIQAGLDERVAAAAVDDWWWIDAFYMAGPVYARFSQLHGTNSYLAKMDQFYQDMKVRRGLFSEAHGLWYRDEQAKAATTANGQKQFWGRGNGWVIAALALVLEEMPAEHPARGEYVAMLQTMAAALKPRQGGDGFWRASLLDAAEAPNPETSSTALIAFALAWGVRHGHLDADEYLPGVGRAWNGLMALALQPDGKVGFSQPQGRAPVIADYHSSNDHGTGAFLLAGSEIYTLVQHLASSPTAAPTAKQAGASVAVAATLQRAGDSLVLTWNAVPGRSYRVLARDSLTSPRWTVVRSSLVATGPLATLEKLRPSAAQQFFRVEME